MAFNPDKIRINESVRQFYESIPEKDYKIEENIFKDFELQEEAYKKSTNIKVIRL